MHRLFILLLCLSSLHAKEDPAHDPVLISRQLKQSIAKTMPCTVAIFYGGSASGVLISPDGLILTAAHVAKHIKDDRGATIVLSDGSTAKAERLGYNEETDYALLKIKQPQRADWPHCQLAATSPTTGALCYTLAHPTGRIKGRPAQARLGRITSHGISRSKPFFLFADCNIQPGDSGGPLFSIDGQLIAIDSSASSHLGLNLFPAIDQYHLDQKRLLNKERWGEPAKGAVATFAQQSSLDTPSMKRLQHEFMRRMKIKYPSTIDFVAQRADASGKLNISQQDIVQHMTTEALAISRKQAFGLGLGDPVFTRKLPEFPRHAISQVTLYGNKKPLCAGIALDGNHLLTKASEVDKTDSLSVAIDGKLAPAKVLATDPRWDLALVRLQDGAPLKPISWPKNIEDLEAGDLLLARDLNGSVRWNVAADSRRPLRKNRSMGPVRDRSLISRHRAPYPMVVRHALPLFAKDAGVPVFNQEGDLVGMHIARFSRTLGLLIPANALRELSRELLTKAKEGSQEVQP